MTPRFKRRTRWFWSALLAAAALAHVLAPDFFKVLYPPFLPWPDAVIAGTAVVEAALAALLWWPAYEKRAWTAIAVLMTAYLPVHVYVAFCHLPGWPVPLWLAWVRLPLQLVFIAWPWRMRG